MPENSYIGAEYSTPAAREEKVVCFWSPYQHVLIRREKNPSVLKRKVRENKTSYVGICFKNMLTKL